MSSQKRTRNNHEAQQKSVVETVTSDGVVSHPTKKTKTLMDGATGIDCGDASCSNTKVGGVARTLSLKLRSGGVMALEELIEDIDCARCGINSGGADVKWVMLPNQEAELIKVGNGCLPCFKVWYHGWESLSQTSSWQLFVEKCHSDAHTNDKVTTWVKNAQAVAKPFDEHTENITKVEEKGSAEDIQKLAPAGSSRQSLNPLFANVETTSSNMSSVAGPKQAYLAAGASVTTAEAVGSEPVLPLVLNPCVQWPGPSLEWAIACMAGQPGWMSVRSPSPSHPHAIINHTRVRVNLLPVIYHGEENVLEHFQRLIGHRRECNKPFYIGATTRHPVERFPLRTKLPHDTAYNNMVVAWVGTATEARRIEKLVISMARYYWPSHCMNDRPGGEGIAPGIHPASVYMCEGGKSSLLRQRHDLRGHHAGCTCIICQL